MVKNIVFDMGQVLLSHIPQRYLHKIFTDETAIQAIDKGVFGSPEWTMLDEGVLTEEEALVKIDLLGHDFFAYTDRDTSMVNVLYRRDDGGYGLLKQTEE